MRKYKFHSVIQVLIFAISSLCGSLNAQDSLVQTYPFDLNPLSGNLSQDLESLLDEHNFIFTSELHYNKYSLEIQKKFIIHLASINKLDKIGLEQDYAYGYEVNHFFKTGDTLRLRKLFDFHPEMTVSTHTTDFYKYYLQLKNLADSLQFDLKFYGIDRVMMEGYKGSLFSVLNILSECNNSLFENVVGNGWELLDRNKLGHKPVRKWLETLEIEVRNYKIAADQCIPKDEFEDLENIIYSIDQSLVNRKNRGRDREKLIADNFRRYFKSNDCVYTQYGYPHVFRNSKDKYALGGKTFIDHLNDESFFKNKSVIVQFMPWQGSNLYFHLLSEDEVNQIRPLIEKHSFPQLVDFRILKSVKGCFDFAILVND